MSKAAEGHTLFLPQPNPRTPGGQDVDTGLPTDLISQSAYRLRTLALLFAFVFFMAGFLPALVMAEARAQLFSHVLMWLPGALSIAMALVVAFIACSKLISIHTAMTIGLIFEVLGSYGIAAAEFLDPLGLVPEPNFTGLSWVAVWTMLFTVVVPTAPRQAVIAALVSVSAVPVIVTLGGRLAHIPTPGMMLFFGFVLPYLLVVLMSYVGSQIIYGLGREVSRARAGQLRAGRADRTRWNGRGLAREASLARATGGHQADSSADAR